MRTINAYSLLEKQSNFKFYYNLKCLSAYANEQKLLPAGKKKSLSISPINA